MNDFMEKINYASVRKAVDYLFVGCIAARCALKACDGEFGDSLVLFACGLMMLLKMYETDVASQIIERYHDDGEDFVKATYDESDGSVDVIAGGNKKKITMCCESITKFMGKFIAQETGNNKAAADFFRLVFAEALEIYCEVKGIDENEFFKSVGLNKLD